MNSPSVQQGACKPHSSRSCHPSPGSRFLVCQPGWLPAAAHRHGWNLNKSSKHTGGSPQEPNDQQLCFLNSNRFSGVHKPLNAYDWCPVFRL